MGPNEKRCYYFPTKWRFAYVSAVFFRSGPHYINAAKITAPMKKNAAKYTRNSSKRDAISIGTNGMAMTAIGGALRWGGGKQLIIMRPKFKRYP